MLWFAVSVVFTSATMGTFRRGTLWYNKTNINELLSIIMISTVASWRRQSPPSQPIVQQHTEADNTEIGPLWGQSTEAFPCYDVIFKKTIPALLIGFYLFSSSNLNCSYFVCLICFCKQVVGVIYVSKHPVAQTIRMVLLKRKVLNLFRTTLILSQGYDFGWFNNRICAFCLCTKCSIQ